MNRTDFIDRFGGVFEHSPWVAERGFDRLEDPALVTASTVHVALCHAFREASREERLAVLQAHPDLAGKLGFKGDLTAPSRAEQSSAGLERLSEAEHARFTELNDLYRKRFGFPFIIAVRGLDKDEILRTFEHRMANTEPEEFSTACDEVEKIALLRLKSLLPEA